MSYKIVEVEIDLDDIIEDNKEKILHELTTDELIEELRDRDVYLESETNYEEAFFLLQKLYFSPDELYRHLCDIADCGYHEPKDSLLNKIKDLM